MIAITIYRNSKDYITRFRVEGHSGYDVKGKDIVCAAVSALAQTSLIALIEVLNIEEKDIDYFIDESKGLLDVNIPTIISVEKLDKIQIVFKTFEVGIKSIVESYPNYVTLAYKEV